MIEGLQKHNFKWEDKSYEELIKEYPKAKSYIGWWTNHRDTKEYGFSMFNINYNKYLKEFLIQNPPTFKISSKCCEYAKKRPAKQYKKLINPDLNVIGVRKAEGGVRATSYKSCFDDKTGEPDEFRPIFWLKDEDKKDYEKFFKVKHSDCYEKWGMKRTGCVGCPFNIKVLEELELVQKYEPKLYKACMNIFGKSYEYTEKYRRFKAKKKLEEIGQMTFW